MNRRDRSLPLCRSLALLTELQSPPTSRWIPPEIFCVDRVNLDQFVGLEVRQSSTWIRFSVKVQPRASRDEIVGVHAGALKIKLTAPPVEGAANEAMIAFLTGEFNIATRRISIISGASARSKVIEIATQ